VSDDGSRGLLRQVAAHAACTGKALPLNLPSAGKFRDAGLDLAW
jgi:hypothetical protein